MILVIGNNGTLLKFIFYIRYLFFMRINVIVMKLEKAVTSSMKNIIKEALTDILGF